jgi:hypothetical protein
VPFFSPQQNTTFEEQFQQHTKDPQTRVNFHIFLPFFIVSTRLPAQIILFLLFGQRIKNIHLK